MRLMREDFWSGLRRRHKDYRHPARVGCIHTIERSKFILIKNVLVYESY